VCWDAAGGHSVSSAAASLSHSYPLALSLGTHFGTQLIVLHMPAPTRVCTQVAKRELALECNYSYEAAAQGRFRELVAADPQLAQLFYVPQVGELGLLSHASSSTEHAAAWRQRNAGHAHRALTCVWAAVVCLCATPQVYPELCSRQILTTEWVNGITIDKVRGVGAGLCM
jgi:hypothetical protein